jgi:TetR/AcrR family transcriptional regulator
VQRCSTVLNRRMTASTRDETETETEKASARQRILDVAIKEFSRKGFAAVRIDTIARLANANKQLIYYYFSSKTGLYDAVLDQLVATYRPRWEALQSATVSEMIRLRAEHARTDTHWQRLLAWEGLELWKDPEADIHLQAVRTQAYRGQEEVIARGQRNGEFPADIDPSFASLLLLYASLGPAAFPQITKMVTGLEPGDPAIADGIHRALQGMISSFLTAERANHEASGPSQ